MKSEPPAPASGVAARKPTSTARTRPGCTRVTDPHAYLTAARDPELLLRAAAESVLREEVAGRPFLALLTIGRSRFQGQVLVRLHRRAAGLGLELDGLTLHDLHPPAEVVEVYNNVARALEDRDRQVNEAQAAATRTRRQAEAKALQTVRDAEGRPAGPPRPGPVASAPGARR